MGKAYERKRKADDFLPQIKRILPDLIRVVRTGGSICWQVGYHVSNGVATPLDYLVYDLMSAQPNLHLRNRIIWTFGHGLHSEDRFSGRHETILWFTKGKRYRFDLDAVRVLQTYPGKKHYKGTKKGKLSGNPKGKNPSDVWSMPDVWKIPNVKANHVEKTAHPCQFPVALVTRLIKALTKRGALVLDPFAGAGTTGAACALVERRFVGAETSKKYHRIGTKRIRDALNGKLKFRPSHRPVYQPPPDTPLTRVPLNWKIHSRSARQYPARLNGDSRVALCLNEKGRSVAS
jgi:adenine-specific DNA-methyltransferase